MILHDHNQKTYANIISMFRSVDRVAVVQPTGTGKSFLILKLIEDNPESNFVISAPNNYIFEHIKSHAQKSGVNLEKCRFITYHYNTADAVALQSCLLE